LNERVALRDEFSRKGLNKALEVMLMKPKAKLHGKAVGPIISSIYAPFVSFIDL
jgi:hypothetical protein